MKIGNKYNYFKRISKGDDNSRQQAAYEMSKMPVISYFVSAYFEGIKSWTKRIEKRKLDVGKIIFVERWDGNGIPDEETITNIEQEDANNEIVVFTKNGHFSFNKENCNKDNIDFTWTCKGKDWEKRNMKWIDGSRYYFKSQI